MVAEHSKQAARSGQVEQPKQPERSGQVEQPKQPERSDQVEQPKQPEHSKRTAHPKQPKSSKPSAAQKRSRVALAHKVLRFAVQIAFFILAPAVFSGAFSAIKYLCTQVGLGEAIEATSFVILLIAVLGFTILFGRFFCGYACAFGTLGDVLYAIPEFIRSKTPVPRLKFPVAVVRVLSVAKYVVLFAIGAACYLGVWGQYSGYSPWEAFAAVLSGSVEDVDRAALVVLGVICVCMMVRERFFCQFLCPLGAVFSLMPVLGCSQYGRERAHCAKNCGRCEEACPVSIYPDTGQVTQGECISCGRCADVCPMGNVNMVAIEKRLAKKERLAKFGDAARPLRKTRESWYLLRGSGVGYVLLKAVVLLALFWVVGAMRYLPPFAEVFGWFPWPF